MLSTFRLLGPSSIIDLPMRESVINEIRATASSKYYSAVCGRLRDCTVTHQITGGGKNRGTHRRTGALLYDEPSQTLQPHLGAALNDCHLRFNVVVHWSYFCWLYCTWLSICFGRAPSVGCERNNKFRKPRNVFFTLNSAHVANCCENFTMGIDRSRLNLCCFGLNFGDTVYRREVVKLRWRDALHDSWKRLRLCLPWNWPFIDRAQTGARKTQDQKMKDQVTGGGKCRTGIRRTKSPSIKSVTWSYIIYLYWRLWTQATASTISVYMYVQCRHLYEKH